MTDLEREMQEALKKQLPLSGQLYVNHAAAVCAAIAQEHFESTIFAIRMKFEMDAALDEEDPS